MKNVVKFLIIATVCFSLLIINCQYTKAKNYYDTIYGNDKYAVPYEKPQNLPYDIEQNHRIASIYTMDTEKKATTAREDFNGDGKEEKIKLSLKFKNNYKKTIITLKSNNKTLVNKIITNTFINHVSFSTYKLNGKCISVLMYGDEDFAGGGAIFYRWKNSKKLVTLKGNYRAKGYLSVFIAKDKKLNKEVLYICDAEQLYNLYGKTWPANVLEKYKKYADKESTSVTKSTYYRFLLKDNQLKKVGTTDSYYRVGIAYD